MTSSASPQFRWNVGGVFGPAIGASAWMPATALTSGWPGTGISLSIAAASLILISAYLIWRCRRRLPAFRGLILLLAVGFAATLLFLAGAQVLGLSFVDSWPGENRVSPLRCSWILLFYPALAAYFWFLDRKSSTSKPGASS